MFVKKIALLIFVLFLLAISVNAETMLLKCSTINDCPIALKNECDDFLLSCSSGICIYDPSHEDRVICENEIVTMIKQLEQTEDQITTPSDNSFTFSQSHYRPSFMFGDTIFNADKLEYSCQIPSEQGTYKVPYNGDDCWETTINFLGNFGVKNTQEIQINDYIGIKYIASGKLRVTDSTYYIPYNEWGNTFYFTITNGINVYLDSENKYVLKDSIKEITLNIWNNLPSHQSAFVEIKQKRKMTNQILPDQTYETMLENGNNAITVPIDTEGLGINQIEIKVFYPIEANNNILLESNNLITNYEVVNEIPDIPDYTVVEEKVEITYDFDEIPTHWIIIGGIVILLVIVRLFRRKT